MSIRVDSTSWIDGAVVVGDPGLGVPAEAVPSTGEHGAGYAYAALSFPADAAKEVCGRITSWPVSGTLNTYEDTSFEYDGPSFNTTYQLYVDGVATGTPQTFSVTVAAPGIVDLSPIKGGVTVNGKLVTLVTVGGSAVVLSPIKSSINVNGYSGGVVVVNAPIAANGNCNMYIKVNGEYLRLSF